ncbi:MAG TPA: hypothetical protein VM639_15040 [Dongiaceae bacterium]|nr:hypothetical protein [Dongiaceae bacterium]
MYNVPWQNGRIYQTPVGLLSASFLLRPNTMFHPEGEWSVRLVLTPLYAYRLRQMIAPAHDDVVARAKAMHENLPVEQQVNKPFKENPYWQAVPTEGGLETENVLFTFRLPTVQREPTLAVAGSGPSVAGQRGGRRHVPKIARHSGEHVYRPALPVVGDAAPAEPVAAHPAVPSLGKVEPVLEVPTRVPLFDALGDEMTGLTLEPDGWDACVSFSVQQYWLRSFGAGVTLRLQAVHLLGQHLRSVQKGAAADGEIDPDLPLPIAL